MSILFLTHPEADYGGAFLYQGLCQLYGKSEVYDWPRKESYHGDVHHYPLRGEQGMTAPFAWMPKSRSPWTSLLAKEDAPTLDDIARLVRSGKFHLVVVESCREGAKQATREVLDIIQDAQLPIVVHDGEDYLQVDEAFAQEIGATLYLKREFIQGDTPETIGDTCRVIPFPFSSPRDPIDDDDTWSGARDILFAMGNTWHFRQEAANWLHAKYAHMPHEAYIAIAPDNNGSANNQVLIRWEDYLPEMGNSKAAVSIRGFGWDTCRYWEIPTSTVMICDKVPISIPHPFEDGKNCIMFEPDDIASFELAIERALKMSRADRSTMLAEGKAHLLAHHTNLARARYLKEMLDGTA